METGEETEKVSSLLRFTHLEPAAGPGHAGPHGVVSTALTDALGHDRGSSFGLEGGSAVAAAKPCFLGQGSAVPEGCQAAPALLAGGGGLGGCGASAAGKQLPPCCVRP